MRGKTPQFLLLSSLFSFRKWPENGAAGSYAQVAEPQQLLIPDETQTKNAVAFPALSRTSAAPARGETNRTVDPTLSPSESSRPDLQTEGGSTRIGISSEATSHFDFAAPRLIIRRG